MDNQIAVIENSIEVFKTAPNILTANRDRSARAVTIGKKIMTEWGEAWTIENEEERFARLAALDQRSNEYLVKCNTALTEEKEARAPITQLMDSFKKMFTEAEMELDKSKAGTVSALVQKHRDVFAAEVFKRNERKKAEEAKKLAKNLEAVEIRAKMESNLRAGYLETLKAKKLTWVNSFNAITLENYDEKSVKLANAKPVAPELTAPTPNGMVLQHHTLQEVQPWATEIMVALAGELTSNFVAELNLLRDELVEKLPSKKKELEEQKRIADEAEAARVAEMERQRLAEEARQKEIAAANSAAAKRAAEAAAMKAREAEAAKLREMEAAAAAEKAAAEKAQAEREAAEKARMEAEAQEAERRANEKVEMKRVEGNAMSMFASEEGMADAVPTGTVRTSQNIVIKHGTGYLLVFQFWYEHEGKNLPLDKIGNTKLDQMKAWCEKYAQKTGEKIESKFLAYEDDFKAVNKKTK
jgi:hypothetical protein